MKAMVFAAGLGTRLGAISRTTPKCLVDVGGQPMLEIVLRRLAAAGVTEAVVNVHYLREQVEEFLKSRALPLTVHISPETELLGTGGGLKHARRFLDSGAPFFVHNADVFSEIDLAALYRAHRSDAAATLAVMQRSTSRALLFSTDGVLVGWENGDGSRDIIAPAGPSAERWAFSGIQVVSPAIFEYLERDTGDFSIIRTYMHVARSGGAVRAFQMGEAFWIDVGTPEKLEALRVRMEGAK